MLFFLDILPDVREQELAPHPFFRQFLVLHILAFFCHFRLKNSLSCIFLHFGSVMPPRKAEMLCSLSVIRVCVTPARTRQAALHTPCDQVNVLPTRKRHVALPAQRVPGRCSACPRMASCSARYACSGEVLCLHATGKLLCTLRVVRVRVMPTRQRHVALHASRVPGQCSACPLRASCFARYVCSG